MSQHDDRYAGTDLPRTTGEFRAAQDVSASTAEFKRFMGDQNEQEQRRGTGAWPAQPWAGGQARGRGRNRVVLYLIGALVLVALIAAYFIAAG